jgi:hypothetical protein
MPSEVAADEPQARAITYARLTAPPQAFVDMRKTCPCTSTTVYATFDPNSIVTAAPVLITHPAELRREIRPHAVRTPIVRVPQRRERPRERRAAVRRQARAPTSDDPSPSSDLEVRSLARFQRDVQRAFGDAG